jgi:prepilin-type processing-associated H-X9-DG protein
MAQKKILWLVIAMLVVASLLTVVIVHTWHPCSRQLHRITKILDEIWSDPNLIAQLKTPDDYQRLLEQHLGEPLTCPETGVPYQFCPAQGIVLADAQPHRFAQKRLAIEWQHTTTGERFRVVTWSPSAVSAPPLTTVSPPPSSSHRPHLFQALLDFFRSLVLASAPQTPHDCRIRLLNVGMALSMYVQDYDERFPPMKVIADTQSVLLPYLRSQDMLFCAVTGQPYFPNPQLHLKLLKDVLQPAETPTFYEMSLHPDGMRGMVFVDGHVKFVLPSQWQVLQQRYQLPLPP